MSQKLVCNCNGTMPLDAKALGVPVHTSLCRQEVGSVIKAFEGSDSLVIACTQVSALFDELAGPHYVETVVSNDVLHYLSL
jgi:hypothetical protein